MQKEEHLNNIISGDAEREKRSQWMQNKAYMVMKEAMR